jgi:hypothetical protein
LKWFYPKNQKTKKKVEAKKNGDNSPRLQNKNLASRGKFDKFVGAAWAF